MTGETLIEDIVAIINSPRFNSDWVESKLDLAMSAITSRVLLPALCDGVDTVDTAVDTNEADLPTDFHSNLYYAATADGPIRTMGTLARGEINDFAFDGDDSEGEVEIVGIRGTKLVYYRVPSVATTITLRYVRKAAAITDTPTEIDGYAGYQEYEVPLANALTAFVCAKAYKILEAGIEGAQVNTQRNEADYEAAIAEMTSLSAAFRLIPAPERTSNWV